MTARENPERPHAHTRDRNPRSRARRSRRPPRLVSQSRRPSGPHSLTRQNNDTDRAILERSCPDLPHSVIFPRPDASQTHTNGGSTDASDVASRRVNLGAVLLQAASTDPDGVARGRARAGSPSPRSPPISGRLAAHLAARIQPGDRVALLAGNELGVRARLPRDARSPAGSRCRSTATSPSLELARELADGRPRARRRVADVSPTSRAARARSARPTSRCSCTTPTDVGELPGRSAGAGRRAPRAISRCCCSPRVPPARRSPRCSRTDRCSRTSSRCRRTPGCASVPTTSRSRCCRCSTCSGSTSCSASR